MKFLPAFLSAVSFAIGGNASVNVNVATANFIGNDFTIVDSSLNSLAEITGNNVGSNFAKGIGGNAVVFGRAIFINNLFNITGTSITAAGIVRGTNTGTNFVTGINLDGGGSTVNIDQSSVDVLAQAAGAGTNIGLGLVATGPGDVINATNTSVTVTVVP